MREGAKGGPVEPSLRPAPCFSPLSRIMFAFLVYAHAAASFFSCTWVHSQSECRSEYFFYWYELGGARRSSEKLGVSHVGLLVPEGK